MRLETRQAGPGDMPAVKRLIDEYIAEDYYALEELEGCLRPGRDLFHVVTDADRGGAVISFFYAFLSTLEEALPLLHVARKPEALRRYAPDTPVGVYKTASTARAYRKLGICSSFVRDVEPELRRRGARMIVSTAWRTPEGVIPVKGILRDTGFTAVAEVIRPWEHLDLFCTSCRRRHCICDAIFYIKKLDEAKDGDISE